MHMFSSLRRNRWEQRLISATSRCVREVSMVPLRRIFCSHFST